MCGGHEFEVDSIDGAEYQPIRSGGFGLDKAVQTRGWGFGWVNGIGDDNDSYLNHDDFTIVWLEFLDRNSR